MFVPGDIPHRVINWRRQSNSEIFHLQLGVEKNVAKFLEGRLHGGYNFEEGVEGKSGWTVGLRCYMKSQLCWQLLSLAPL